MEMLLVCEYDLTYRDVKSTFIMFMPQIGFINIFVLVGEKSMHPCFKILLLSYEIDETYMLDKKILHSTI